MAHILAWYIHHGVWPTDEVDHRNGIPLDNRISNLREASRWQQLGNTRLRSDSRSGVKGVRQSRNGKRWLAHIKRNGKACRLGTFDTIEEASAAYALAAKNVFGEFARWV
jgi:hypothetical protein